MATAATIDWFETRTYEALAGVTRMRRALSDAHHLSRILPIEFATACVLRRLVAVFDHRWLSTLSADQAQQFSPHFAELHSKLNQVQDLLEAGGHSRSLIHRPFLRELARTRERVGDVLESMYLGLDEGFRQLVTECSKEVQGRRPRRDWRSSLASMRD